MTSVGSQSEAKRFFVEKVLAQARAEQVALSEAERGMLSWSESDPEFMPDSRLPELLAAEMSDDEYERKVAALLARGFSADFAAKRETAERWRQALTVLRQGDHYILVMLEQSVGRSLKRWWEFVPGIVNGARYFLITAILVWSGGVIVAAADIWRSLSAGASPPNRATVALLTWRAILLSTAIFAYWGLRRRRPSARWLTVALGTLVLYLMIPGLEQAWRAVRGDYRPLPGAFDYSSRGEGVIALTTVAIIWGAIAFFVQRLASGRQAMQYFADDDQS